MLETDVGEFETQSLVIATGGLSIPQIGSSSFGYRIAEQFGVGVTPLRAGLVPLVFARDQLAQLSELPGVALDAEVSCNTGRFEKIYSLHTAG